MKNNKFRMLKLVLFIGIAATLSGCSAQMGSANSNWFNIDSNKSGHEEIYDADWDACKAEGAVKYSKKDDDTTVPYFYLYDCMRNRGWRGLIR
jgi:hypothetical protein